MTPNLWTLPETVHFADTDWRVNTDFRDVLEILRWLDGSADPALTDSERWYVAAGAVLPGFFAHAANAIPRSL